MVLELVVIHAIRTALDVKLDLQRLRIVQLSIDVAVELVRTLFASHSSGTCLMP